MKAPKSNAGELLAKVKRYEAALLRIAEKADEQKALMEHRQKTGQEVPPSDLQRYFAYLKTARIAAKALDRPEIAAALKPWKHDVQD